MNLGKSLSSQVVKVKRLISHLNVFLNLDSDNRHNFGLAHSGGLDGETYTDHTGFMVRSRSFTYIPLKKTKDFILYYITYYSLTSLCMAALSLNESNVIYREIHSTPMTLVKCATMLRRIGKLVGTMIVNSNSIQKIDRVHGELSYEWSVLPITMHSYIHP